MRQLCFAWTALVLAAPAAAATINVGPTQAITTIQGGIDAAAAGDVIRIDDGVYNEDVANTKSRLVIDGQSRDGVVVNGEVTFTGAKRCIIQDLTINGVDVALDIDGNSHGNRFANVILNASDPAGVGMQVDGNRNTLFRVGVFSADDAFVIDGSQNSLVSCLVDSPDGDGILVNGDRNSLRGCVAASAGGDGFVIDGSGNVLFKCVAGGCTGAGMVVSGDGNTVAKQISSGNVDSGITIGGDGNVITRTILGAVLGNFGPGIVFAGADGNLVERCIVIDGGDHAITLGDAGNARDNRLERNKIGANDGDGILLAATANADDNWVERNIIALNTGNGITLASDNNVVILNKLSGNGGAIVDSGAGNEVALNKF